MLHVYLLAKKSSLHSSLREDNPVLPEFREVLASIWSTAVRPTDCKRVQPQEGVSTWQKDDGEIFVRETVPNKPVPDTEDTWDVKVVDVPAPEALRDLFARARAWEAQ